MSINCFNGGFYQTFDNFLVKKIVVRYVDLFENISDCSIHYKNDMIYHLKIKCSSFNAQYGLAVSSDGKMLFSGTWYEGLLAYDIESGLLKWKYPKGKNRTIIVSNDKLIVARANASVFMLDANTGEKMGYEIKTGTVINIYPLTNSCFFLDSFRGKCCIARNDDLGIVHIYEKAETNPRHCLSWFINHVELNIRHHVIIRGYEDYPNSSFNPQSLIGTKYYRELTSFSVF